MAWDAPAQSRDDPQEPRPVWPRLDSDSCNGYSQVHCIIVLGSWMSVSSKRSAKNCWLIYIWQNLLDGSLGVQWSLGGMLKHQDRSHGDSATARPGRGPMHGEEEEEPLATAGPATTQPLDGFQMALSRWNFWVRAATPMAALAVVDGELDTWHSCCLQIGRTLV